MHIWISSNSEHILNVIGRLFIREKLQLLKSETEIDEIYLLTGALKSQIHGRNGANL
jgi:hypothetical protein